MDIGHGHWTDIGHGLDIGFYNLCKYNMIFINENLCKFFINHHQNSIIFLITDYTFLVAYIRVGDICY